jgi:hypothetical protein
MERARRIRVMKKRRKVRKRVKKEKKKWKMKVTNSTI